MSTLPPTFIPVFSEFFDLMPNYPLLTPSWVELVDLRWCQQGDSLRGGEELHLKEDGERKVRREKRRGKKEGKEDEEEG